MSIVAFLSVLRARAIIIIWAALIATLAAFLIARIVPQNYEAAAKVQVDSIQENLLTGLAEPRLRVSEFLGQQAAIVTSRTVALKVLRDLIGESYISFEQYEDDWRKTTGGELVPGNDARLWTADQLLDRLVVRQNIAESTLTIIYRGENPSQAARFANAFADSYMITVLEQRKRRAARNAESFSEETKTLEKQVENAREELSEYQQQSGIVTIGSQQLESVEVELASLTSRLAEARADYAEAASLFELAKETAPAELGTIPIPDNNIPGRTAQGRLAAVNARLTRILQRYGENHPDYQEGIVDLQAQQKIIFMSIQERTEYARRRVAKLGAEVKIQKRRVVDLQKTKQRFDVLEKNLETNRTAYDFIAARTLQEGLQSRVDTVDVLLLSRAVPPAEPLIPVALIIIIAGLVLGVGLGSSAGILIELLEGRLRSCAGLQQAARAPVFAEIKMPKNIKRSHFI